MLFETKKIPRIRARSTLPHSAHWEVLSFFLSQKAYFNRKNFVEHNGEITNRKPYQKSPMSKQSKKKKEKIDKKIFVMTEEEGMQNVVKSFLNEHSHFYAPFRNLCLRIRILLQKGFCLIVPLNSFTKRTPILHSYLMPKFMRHISTCSFVYKNNLTL